MKTIKQDVIAESRQYWKYSTRASFLTFLSSKRAGVNQQRTVPITRQTDDEFVRAFLKEGDEFVNPTPFTSTQPLSFRDTTNLVSIIYSHRYNRSLFYASAFECFETSGQRHFKFTTSYIHTTRECALRVDRLSLTKIVAWLYRTEQFKINTRWMQLKKRFVDDFRITEDELAVLFIDDGPTNSKALFEEIAHNRRKRGAKRQTQIAQKRMSTNYTRARRKAAIATIDSANSVGDDSSNNRMFVSRKVRDTRNAYRIKELYDFRCQICGKTIRLPNGQRYAEAHHIKPHGQPHNGPDKTTNLICVCPDHHALLDCYAIKLSKSRLRLKRHEIDDQYIAYHNDLYTERFGSR